MNVVFGKPKIIHHPFDFEWKRRYHLCSSRRGTELLADDSTLTKSSVLQLHANSRLTRVRLSRYLAEHGVAHYSAFIGLLITCGYRSCSLLCYVGDKETHIVTKLSIEQEDMPRKEFFARPRI